MTANQALDQVLVATWPILLDFDGPVTHLFVDGRNRMVADRIRDALPADLDLPEELRDTYDPLVILRWAGKTLDQDLLHQAEDACIAGEVAAANASIPTPGVAELLTACAQAGRPVVVVSNNAEAAIRAFLATHQLAHLVEGIVARVPGKPELMKPHPQSVYSALDQLRVTPEQCVMIGDSVTDVEVCQTTGVRSIGFAKTPRRGRELYDAGADALARTLTEIARNPGVRRSHPVG